jgi:predicted ATP-dependent protease
VTNTIDALRIAPDGLRWHCDGNCIPYDTTAEAEPLAGVLAQPTALSALEFGLATKARGQNIFVRGPRGTGRMTMVRQAVHALDRARSSRSDRCYVHNFAQPDRPRLISLPAGHGKRLRRRLRELAAFISNDLPKALESEPLISEQLAVQGDIRSQVEALTEPLEQELRAAGMALVTIQQGPVTQTMIFPLVDGEPVPPGQLKKMRREGKVSEQRVENFESHFAEFQKRLQAVTSELNRIETEGIAQIQKLQETAARSLLKRYCARLARDFPQPSVAGFLAELVADVIETRLQGADDLPDPAELYGINVIAERGPNDSAPVVEEHTPSLVNLLGTVELKWTRMGPAPADYTGIRAGSLLRADGGYLILDVDDLTAEPGAYRALMRTLRTGKLEIVPPELGWLQSNSLVSPEPIDIDVRVIMVGDPLAYYQLDTLDPDFGELFKVLADFDDEIPRDEQGIRHYAAVVAQILREDELPPFDRSGLAAITEHGARIAARGGKLTARFGRIADIVREAAFLAQRAGEQLVSGDRVREAVLRTRERASLPSRKFQELITAGTIRVETTGSVVGQVNGLAVIQSGPITYGFPARITATIGPGRAGLINIEGTAALSGAIHTKGFHILGGCLRHLLRAQHPLAFSASMAFEQSYGGIDGDSASGAEICCMLSALTGVPLKQSIAITGAIDQFGHIQPIGGVNEKIEGFFNTCRFFGLTGDQGVIIPRANAADLMLRPDLVAAARAGQFHVFAVDTVAEALEVLTGIAAGEYGEDGYPRGTLLRLAVDQARDYWRKTLASPDKLTRVADDTEGADSGDWAGSRGEST